MKKFLISLMCLGLLWGCAKEEPVTTSEKMDVNIKVVDEIEGKEIVNATIKTSYVVLADILENDIDFDVVLEESEYGKYIVSMVGLEATDKNFWVYESDNNADCKAAGMCMSISETKVQDGDNFTFIYTNSFE